MRILIPNRLERTVLAMHGETGARWLRELPALIGECAERWELRVGEPFDDSSYHWVAPVVAGDGSPAVLKLGLPSRSLAREAAYLEAFAGEGAVRQVTADVARGALLLERLEPGTPLSSLTLAGNDDEATLAAASVMRRLHRAPPAEHDFPTVADWAAALDRYCQRCETAPGPLPPTLVRHAMELFADLLATSAPAVLLHGDLHHENVLAAHRAPWLAIDPQGVIGEPACEVGAFLRNPTPDLLRLPDVRHLLARRIDTLAAELALDRDRLRAWGVANAVLSAVWSIEDEGEGWEAAIDCAELLLKCE